MPTSSLSNDSEYYLGVGLAVLSTFFIGASFVIKKKALLRLQVKGSVRAGSGGYGYLREWLWWTGLIFMGIGEASNFAAYAFAPASLVTPLGALSVLVTAALSSKILGERLNIFGKLGCSLCLIGSTMIVLHCPKSNEIETIDLFLQRLQSIPFIFYCVLVFLTFFITSFYYGPRYGHRNVLVYVILCSSVGSLSVMACKGVGLALKASLKSNDEIHSLTWLCVIFLFIFVSVQMNYLNKALDLFATGIVTPIYYVFFTTLVIIASSLLLEEWRRMSGGDVVGSVCGFSNVLIGIVMLNGLRDCELSWKDVHATLRKVKEVAKGDEAEGESLMGLTSNGLPSVKVS